MLRIGLLPLLWLALVLPARGQTVIFSDGFDPWINYGTVNWLNGPWWDLQNPAQEGHHLEGDQCYIHSMPNAMRGWVNYRVAYDMVHPLGAPYLENVYVRAWIYEEVHVPTFRPYDYPEYTPNAYITLANTDAVVLPVPAGEDWYRIGVRGRYATPTRTQWGDFLFVETKADGPRCLYNAANTQPPHSWPRRPGWRKYAIEVYPFTGSPGDVKFYVDDTLVYSGSRDPDSFVDRIIMGPNVWTYENYWYDDFQFGWIEPPVNCPTLTLAESQRDDTWITVSGKVVSGRYTVRPFTGWATIQEEDRAHGLWVSTSKELSPGDRVTVRGRMASNSAGKRYLDAAEITVSSFGAAPKPLAMSGRAIVAEPDINGLCISLWGRITGRGQEQSGDARHYLVLSIPSLDEPVRVYWDNISDGADPPSPAPNPADGDFVLVTGSVGRETIGTESVRTLWIRQSGDLVIPQ